MHWWFTPNAVASQFRWNVNYCYKTCLVKGSSEAGDNVLPSSRHRRNYASPKCRPCGGMCSASTAMLVVANAEMAQSPQIRSACLESSAEQRRIISPRGKSRVENSYRHWGAGQSVGSNITVIAASAAGQRQRHRMTSETERASQPTNGNRPEVTVGLSASAG
jgi:hypothetical protein